MNDVQRFVPIAEIRRNYIDGVYTENDLLDLALYNPCLFTRLLLDLPFTLSPNQELVLDTFYNPANNFRELLIIGGRKSFKTGMAGIITCFEIGKMLALIDDPHRYYGVMPDSNIYFMNVGAGREEAIQVAFNYICSLAQNSMWLGRYIKNTRREELTFEKNLVARVQASSSRSGRGFPTFLNLYDEQAWMLDTRGHMSGKEVYVSLQPNLKPFAPDSKSVIITSPAGKSGITWELFRSGYPCRVLDQATEHGEQKWRAVFQFPTWEMNPMLKFECERCQHAKDCKDFMCSSFELWREWKQNPDKFWMEYGARFVEAVDAAIPVEKIHRCANVAMIGETVVDKETARMISIDPALNGSYALVMGHKQDSHIIVDLVQFWEAQRLSAQDRGEIFIEDVENRIRNLHQRFRITHVVADQYESASTCQRLQKEGIPMHRIHATNPYCLSAYDFLIARINNETIHYPAYRRLINELTFLQRMQSGGSIKYDAASSYTKDCADALARLVYTLETEGGKTIHFEAI